MRGRLFLHMHDSRAALPCRAPVIGFSRRNESEPACHGLFALMQWCHIAVVRHRGRFKLALDGSVLVCRHEAWAESFDSYLPAESLRPWYDSRHDLRPLFRGAMIVGCALLGLASLQLLHETFGSPEAGSVWAVITHTPWLYATWCLAGTLLALYLGHGIIQAFRQHPTLCITHATDEDAGRFEFWYQPGNDPQLDRLVDALFLLSRKPGHADGGYAVSAGYTRRHVRPLRILFLGAMAITFMLLVLAHFLKVGYETYSGNVLRVTPAFYGVFLLPWAGCLVLFVLGRLRMRQEPARFRMGLRHYHRKEFEKAERRFLDVLREAPDHVPTLYLLTRLTAHRFDFDRAFRFCRELGHLDPEQAEALQEDLWILKRLRGRMAPRKAAAPPVDEAGPSRVE